jgi:hypothetical protein
MLPAGKLCASGMVNDRRECPASSALHLAIFGLGQCRRHGPSMPAGHQGCKGGGLCGARGVAAACTRVISAGQRCNLCTEHVVESLFAC